MWIFRLAAKTFSAQALQLNFLTQISTTGNRETQREMKGRQIELQIVGGTGRESKKKIETGTERGQRNIEANHE